MRESEIVDKLSVWIKSFSWVENDEQTDAVMKFTVSGITDWHLDEILDINRITEQVVKQVVDYKASQFSDVHTTEEISWKIVGTVDALGRSAEALQVHAYLRIVEDNNNVSNNQTKEAK